MLTDKEKKKLPALRVAAAKASREGTPTWVDRATLKLTTKPESERREEMKEFRAKRKALRKVAKGARRRARRGEELYTGEEVAPSEQA